MGALLVPNVSCEGIGKYPSSLVRAASAASDGPQNRGLRLEIDSNGNSPFSTNGDK
jgi:hypothetical protein